MSDTLAGLRRKIDGAGKLQSVVRTMKAVAASSIAQYEAAVLALADYEHCVELGLSVSFRQSAPTKSARTETRAVGAIVFGSDQGLVGQFNEAMAEYMAKTLSMMPGAKRILVVGERIQGCLADAAVSLEGQYNVPSSVDAITSLVGQLQIAIERQQKAGCHEVYVFHTSPTLGLRPESVCQRLLPLDTKWQTRLKATSWPTRNLPEQFGDAETTTLAYVREYLFITLFKACAESLASENASRLAAMQRAEKNIDTIVNGLNRSFNRLRQNAIDEELFDVVAGFNALS